MDCMCASGPDARIIGVKLSRMSSRLAKVRSHRGFFGARVAVFERTNTSPGGKMCFGPCVGAFSSGPTAAHAKVLVNPPDDAV